MLLPHPTAAVIAAALPQRGADAEGLARAARSGRVRGIGLDLWQRMLASPRGAGGVVRRGLREARALHSRERRLVGDLLHDLPRARDLLVHLVETEDSETLWDAWLVWQGLPADDRPELARAAQLDAWAEQALAPLDPVGAWALVAGVPNTVAAELIAALGPQLPAFLAASAQRADIGLRVSQRLGRETLLAELVAAGVDARPGRWTPSAIVVPPGTHLAPFEHAHPGAFEVQDEASQLVATVLDAQPRERVLDACAGAGGKTLALAETGAHVLAADVRERALAELERRAEAAGVRVGLRLWPEEGPVDHRPFDAVLADLPCSGTGTWRRHPELRWRLGELAELLTLQDHVLDRAADAVRPGGRLVMAVCSVLPCEGEERVAAFLARHPDFVVDPIQAPNGLASGPYLRTWPHLHGADGFFAARLRRREPT